MRLRPWFWIGLLLATPPALAGGVDVLHDSNVDFGHYRTYSWGKGVPAAKPENQQLLEQLIEAQLEAKGLTRVESAGDLSVVTRVMAQAEVGSTGTYHYSHNWDAGLIRADLSTVNVGTLMVDLIDRPSGEPVWRGTVRKVFSEHPNPQKVRSKVERSVKKMFRDYPPR
ncbi:MAG: DUF4136 domain-containing protein [bacterium]|nr:DUF4136 domain-containing protein [bacterium]